MPTPANSPSSTATLQAPEVVQNMRARLWRPIPADSFFWFNFVSLFNLLETRGAGWSQELIDYEEVSACSSKFKTPMDTRTWKFTLMQGAAVSNDTRVKLVDAKCDGVKLEPFREGQAQLEQKLWTRLQQK